MRNLGTDQEGSTLVTVLVAMVVLSLMIAGMLQMALMSFKTGKFEEERCQALAAAESGIAVAVAKLNSGCVIPRACYEPTASPSIDSSSANWIGPSTGPMPHELALGQVTSFRVWISEPQGSRTSVVAQGRSGGRSRTIQVALRMRSSNLGYLVSATSTDPFGITLNGSGSISGDMHTEGLRSTSVLSNGNLRTASTLWVRPQADVEGIRNRVGAHFSAVEVDPEEYEYPLPVAPAGLPYRGRLRSNGSPVSISESGVYDSFLINGSVNFTVDTTGGDVVIFVEDDFTINGNVKLNIIGDHSFHLYVNGDFVWNGSTKGTPHEDPTRFVIRCRGRWVTLNGSPALAAVIYAPRSSVTFNGSGTFTGAVVGERVTYNGSGNLFFPTAPEIVDRIRDLNLGGGTPLSEVEAGSWRELR